MAFFFGRHCGSASPAPHGAGSKCKYSIFRKLFVDIGQVVQKQHGVALFQVARKQFFCLEKRGNDGELFRVAASAEIAFPYISDEGIADENDAVETDEFGSECGVFFVVEDAELDEPGRDHSLFAAEAFKHFERCRRPDDVGVEAVVDYVYAVALYELQAMFYVIEFCYRGTDIFKTYTHRQSALRAKTDIVRRVRTQKPGANICGTVAEGERECGAVAVGTDIADAVAGDNFAGTAGKAFETVRGNERTAFCRLKYFALTFDNIFERAKTFEMLRADARYYRVVGRTEFAQSGNIADVPCPHFGNEHVAGGKVGAIVYGL